MKTLTEPQAWRLIARRLHDHFRSEFLCLQVSSLYWNGQIGLETWNAMTARVQLHLGTAFSGVTAYSSDGSCRWYAISAISVTDDTEARECRILAALWLAHEAEK